VGGLETLVALRGLLGHRVALTLVAPEDDFTVHAMEVAVGFGRGQAQRFALRELAADLDARFLDDAVVRVERDDRVAALHSGAELPYDVLVLAIGAHPYPAYEHGVCFDRTHRAQAFDAVVGDLRAGAARRVAIVVPPSCAWTLPAYELALMASWEAGADRVTLITPEREPLEAFGPPAAEMIRASLAAAGVALLEAAEASVPAPDLVELASGARVECDRVVHLPLLAGPNCHGVACDWEGFIEVDDAFRARDGDDLYAIGDATAGRYKQGGLAAQQADVVAEHIAWRVGADHPPRAYRPVLRGLLSTPSGPRYLRAEPPGGALSAAVSRDPLWWPASRVAARWLIPWLAARGVGERPRSEPRRLPTGGLSWAAGAQRAP
jgi:sulfide:quinone oxidoreductase